MNVLGDFKPMELDEGLTKEQRVTELWGTLIFRRGGTKKETEKDHPVRWEEDQVSLPDGLRRKVT